MASENLAIDIAASPERVWQVILDVETWPQWHPSMREVRRLEAEPLRVGSRTLIKQAGQPPVVWEVTELDEGTRFTWVARLPGFDATAVHLVSATADGGARLALTMTWTGVLGGLMGALNRKRAHKSLVEETSGAKARAETAA
jgi:uncharacterized protein YndB with AHSA1/START domain